jgi:hypothetical protein
MLEALEQQLRPTCTVRLRVQLRLCIERLDGDDERALLPVPGCAQRRQTTEIPQ